MYGFCENICKIFRWGNISLTSMTTLTHHHTHPMLCPFIPSCMLARTRIAVSYARGPENYKFVLWISSLWPLSATSSQLQTSVLLFMPQIPEFFVHLIGCCCCYCRPSPSHCHQAPRVLEGRQAQKSGGRWGILPEGTWLQPCGFRGALK